MDDHLKEALDIVKAQASVRIMSEDEIISMVRRLSSDIKRMSGIHLAIPVFSKGYRPKQGKVAP